MSVLREVMERAVRAEAIAEAQQWPGLQFNPAKGDQPTVDALVDKVDRTARNLRATFESLEAIRKQEGVWQGEAARNFAAKLEELPKFLDNAQQSMAKTGKALKAWSAQLSAHQRTAADLEWQARWWREQRERLDESVRQAQAHPAFGLAGRTFGTPQEAQAAQSQVDQAAKLLGDAQREAGKAWESLNEVLEQANRLREEHAGDERAAADAVRRADDGLTPPEPSFFEGFLEGLADAAGVLGAVAGVLACFPPFAPVAGPIAIGCAGVSLAANAGSMMMKGEFDAVTLGSDALGLIPGVNAAKAGFQAVKAGSQSLRTVQGLRTFGVNTSLELADPSVLAQKTVRAFGHKLSDRAVERSGQALDGTVSLGLQTPTVMKWIRGEHDPVVQGMQGVGQPASLAQNAYSAGDTLMPTIGRLTRGLS